MFITSSSRRNHDRHGQQLATGRFLLVMDLDEGGYAPCEVDPVLCTKGHRPLRGIVRTVQLKQLGHFMMGQMTINDEEMSLSGTYGSDGLPKSVATPVSVFWQMGLPLPPELVHRFWTAGGGHNSAGAEGSEVHDWALANLAELSKPYRKPKETPNVDPTPTEP